ncbi:NAD(P)-binding protein [Nocardioides convexus]|uniref:NAD(P)-binding protein n=1 Tax=Nocardioides convexus TaxID=2712224 RepID=UPI003100F808
MYDAVVVGAGQAGLSASYHLRRLGISHVLLDANERPGGAWQHRWDSLTMNDVHGVADLPDAPAPGGSGARANVVLAEWFARYEAVHDLPVVRPVRVDRVTSQGESAGGARRRAGVDDADPGERDGDLDAAVRAVVPGVGGVPRRASCTPPTTRVRRTSTASGCSWSAAAPPRCSSSASLAPRTDVLWVTRRPPVWREHFDESVGRHAIEPGAGAGPCRAAARERGQRDGAGPAPAGAGGRKAGRLRAAPPDVRADRAGRGALGRRQPSSRWT